MISLERIARGARLAGVALGVFWLAGCGLLIGKVSDGLARDLSAAMLNQDDPETVRDAAPAYLLLLDSFIAGDPDNVAVLRSGATLYAAYGSVFVDDIDRARRLTARAFDYGERALCNQNDAACDLSSRTFDEFTAGMQEMKAKDAETLYAYAVSWLAYLRAHSSDWEALADLPKVETVLARLVEIDGDYESANVNFYLGVLNTLRPPALGGKPEEGRAYFERAIALTEGRDLSVKVEFARNYGRMLYDRELHDRLLREVLDADPYAPGLTLLNVLAQRQAQALLDSADEYF